MPVSQLAGFRRRVQSLDKNGPIKSCLIKRRRRRVRQKKGIRFRLDTNLSSHLSPERHCRRIVKSELSLFIKRNGERIGIYFDGFGASEHISVSCAVHRVQKRCRNAMLFFNKHQESLFLFYRGPVWICRNSVPRRKCLQRTPAETL